jgi:hypothetical protein
MVTYAPSIFRRRNEVICNSWKACIEDRFTPVETLVHCVPRKTSRQHRDPPQHAPQGMRFAGRTDELQASGTSGLDHEELSMKDHLSESAMTGHQPKPSIPTIAGILLAAAVLYVLLVLTPASGILSETHVVSHSSLATNER